MRSRILVAGGLLAVAVAVALLAPHDLDGLGALVGRAGPLAPAVFLALWVPATVLLAPGTLLCALGGALFGPLGVALSLLGSPVGALAAFLLARRLGPATLRDRLPGRLHRLTARLERSGPVGVALVRSAPGLPATAFNYACGLTRLPARHFLVGSALGAAPRIVLYGSLGGIVHHLL